MRGTCADLLSGNKMELLQKPSVQDKSPSVLLRLCIKFTITEEERQNISEPHSLWWIVSRACGPSAAADGLKER